MADYTKYNGVAAADIVKIDGVAVANLVKCDGTDKPSSGATRWGAASIDHYISWANAADIADLDTWESNVFRIRTNSADLNDIAYGLDGSGNPLWMATGLGGNDEIMFDGNNDITDDSAWSDENIDTSHGRRVKILYGAGDGASDSSSGSSETRVAAWLSVGRNAGSKVYVYRTTDGGSNWTGLNLDGLTNIADTSNADDHIRSIASDGLGTWLIGQRGNLYISTDSGVSFSFLIQPTGDGGHLIRDIVYTNSTWVVVTKQGADLHVSTCAASTKANMDASGDWSSSTHITDGTNDLNGNGGADSIAAAGAAGRVCVMDGVNVQPMSVSGKTISFVGDRQAIPLTETPANCLATDGSTWLIGTGGAADTGDICRSTNGGEAWGDAPIVDGIEASFKSVISIAPNVLMPI